MSDDMEPALQRRKKPPCRPGYVHIDPYVCPTAAEIEALARALWVRYSLLGFPLEPIRHTDPDDFTKVDPRCRVWLGEFDFTERPARWVWMDWFMQDPDGRILWSRGDRMFRGENDRNETWHRLASHFYEPERYPRQ